MSCLKTTRIPSGTTLKHLHFSGITKYAQGDAIQTYIVNRHLRSKIEKWAQRPSQVILSFEFGSIYTGGRREKFNSHELYECFPDVKFVQTLRGGEVTYHGPGQLVAYPILDLSVLKLKSKCYIDMLQAAIRNTLSDRGVATVDSEHTGAWVDSTTKISSIGARVQRSITSHGISVNSDPDLKYFNDPKLVICGLPGTKQTSIKQVTGDTVAVKDLSLQFTDNLSRLLGVENLEHYEIDKFDDDVTILDKYL